jgi:hypothetical protein
MYYHGKKYQTHKTMFKCFTEEKWPRFDMFASLSIELLPLLQAQTSANACLFLIKSFALTFMEIQSSNNEEQRFPRY